MDLNSMNISEDPEKIDVSDREAMPMFQEILEATCTGSVDLDDDQMDIMSNSYSEILGKSDKTGQEKLKIAIVEETGITTGYTDELEVATPVYEGIDPMQTFMAEDRINAFLQTYSIEGDADKKDQVETEPSNIGSRQDFMKDQKEFLPVNKKSIPLPVAPIDPSVISDLESHARNIATSMDTLIENLTGTLQSISALSVDCVETYRDAVCKTCDAVDANIKSMYQLMAKTEELSKSMKSVYYLQEQIKEIRRLLDMLENVAHPSVS